MRHWRRLQAPSRWAFCAVGIALALAACTQQPPRENAASLPATPGLTAAAEDDCNRSAWARTLLADDTPKLPAQVIALDGERLQWPGATVAPGTHYRLLHAPQPTLAVRIGERAAGVQQAWPLASRASDDPAALPAALRAQFRHVAEGVVLTLPPAAQQALPTLLRGQLLLVQEDGDGRVRAVSRIQHAAALDARYAAAATPLALGATVTPAATTFRLWAPTAHDVALCLYRAGHSGAQQRIALTRDDASGSWQARVDADLSGQYYTYLVDVYVPGVGIVRNRVTDPYAVSLSADSHRALIASLDDPRTMPPAWATSAIPRRIEHAVDMSIYELHVRDFSQQDASVPPPLRGKYSAFTRLESDGMQHLRRLSAAGLTDVHLLPVFDLASVPEGQCSTPLIAAAQVSAASAEPQRIIAATRERDCFNWGYDPLHFNAPEGSYATDAADGFVRIRELRAMVAALHAIGLRVGMDVVFNHTSASGQKPHSVLDRIVPGYYHRLDAVGEVTTSTCCDNTATEHAMMEKLMSDSLLLWATQYRIASFRFDLMGHQPRAAMERAQARVNAATGRRVQFLGEGWNFGEVANGARFVQASQLSLNGSGIGTFNDRLRDAARGGAYNDSADALVRRQGWLNGLSHWPNELSSAAGDAAADRHALINAADLLRAGLAGSIRDYRLRAADGRLLRLDEMRYGDAPAGYVAAPGEVVNYVENHDNETLFDINAYKLPLSASIEERARAQMLGIALVMLAQGTPYLHAGMEILRSKSMDRNSYDSGDWFNVIDWTYRDNGFARGLPREDENGKNWPQITPRLVNPALKPDSQWLRWTLGATEDLLALRASTRLLRLTTAGDIQSRLRFWNVGPTQNPCLLLASIDGEGLPAEPFRHLVYGINACREPASFGDRALAGLPLQLHPVQATPAATDRRPREARYEPDSGRFTVPAQAVVVWVASAR